MLERDLCTTAHDRRQRRDRIDSIPRLAPGDNVCSFCGSNGVGIGGGDAPEMYAGMTPGTLICDLCIDIGAGEIFDRRSPRRKWIAAKSAFPGHPQYYDNEAGPDASRFGIVPAATPTGRFSRYSVRDEGYEIGTARTFEEAAALAQKHADLEAFGSPEDILARWAAYR